MIRHGRMWAVIDSRDWFLNWTMRPTRLLAIEEAVRTCMRLTDYERLKNDKARWRFLYQQKGFRAKKIKVIEDSNPIKGQP
jgi:hypothetical protein